MGKLYTMDGKMLIGSNEIRVGDKVYPVDDRVRTVKRLQEIDTNDLEGILRLGLGDEAVNELDVDNMPFSGFLRLTKLVVAAMTGEDTEEVEARFQAAV